MKQKDFGIVFMGTPDFAVQSLKILHENGFNIVAVITAPDKPAGRGRKLQESQVKKYALKHNLKVLQPTNLKNPNFIEDLKALKADLQVVVAFRMLPEIVWAMPRYGTINLHASLLPQYRGAAPINHALINGETETGVTTFFIEKEIDTGHIIMQKKVKIKPNETAGELHDKLMLVGADLMLKTIDAIINKTVTAVSQDKAGESAKLQAAPKIFPDNCIIDWAQPVKKVYDFIRGLSPYPAARTIISSGNNQLMLKIYNSELCPETHEYQAGQIITDNKTYIKIAAADGFINILELQIQGKKRLFVKDLLNGFDIAEYKIQ